MKIINQSKRKWWESGFEGTIYRYPDGEVVCSDALKVLNGLRANIAKIVFLDPPFNLGKAYGGNGKHADCRAEKEYADYLAKVTKRSAEVLEPGGALYIYHIPKWAIQLGGLLDRHLEFRHWIAVSMKSGFARGQHLYPAHYALLYYTKGKPTSFHRPKIPKPICARCKRDLRDYGGYRQYVENGINLSDVWDDISPVRHKKYKHRSSNELPEKLVSRILTISGSAGGLVVDPFAGAGSMLVAVRKAGMSFVGSEIDQDSLDIINARLTKQRQERAGSGRLSK